MRLCKDHVAHKVKVWLLVLCAAIRVKVHSCRSRCLTLVRVKLVDIGASKSQALWLINIDSNKILCVSTAYVASGNSLFHNSLPRTLGDPVAHVQVLYLPSSPMEWCPPTVISALLIAVIINKILHYLQPPIPICVKEWL